MHRGNEAVVEMTAGCAERSARICGIKFPRISSNRFSLSVTPLGRKCFNYYADDDDDGGHLSIPRPVSARVMSLLILMLIDTARSGLKCRSHGA